jgi:hypothetical protein
MKMNKEGTLLRPQHTYYSDEYAHAMCDLHLSDVVIEDDKGKLKLRYRLHAKHPHTIEGAMAYNILCPKCHRHLKQVGRSLSYHDLGLYACHSAIRFKEENAMNYTEVRIYTGQPEYSKHFWNAMRGQKAIIPDFPKAAAARQVLMHAKCHK